MTVRTKLIAAGVILAAAVGYLATAAAKSGWVYYLEVDRFIAESQYHSQRVRLHGKVAADGLTVSPAALTASFGLHGRNQASAAPLAIRYHGVIPDMFEAGREVVVEGKLDPAGNVFVADVLMTKCASKYEPNSPHKTDAGGAVGPGTIGAGNGTAGAKEHSS